MLITTHEQLREMAAAYAGKDFAFDVETMGEHRGDPRRNRVVWLAMATDGRTDVIPLGHPNGEFVERVFPMLPSGRRSTAIAKSTVVWSQPPAQLRFDAEVREILLPLFTDPNVTKVGHNLKFDLCSIEKHLKVLPVGPYFCTQIASFIIDQRVTGVNGLSHNVDREVGYKMVKGVGKEIEAHPFKDVAKYAHIDAKYTWLLFKELKPKVEALENNVFLLEMDVLGVVCRMEQEGVPMNVPALTELDERLKQQLLEAEAAVYRAAGRAFPVKSNAEKVKILYGSPVDGGQGLKVKKRTGGGAPSVDKEALQAHAGKNKVVDAIIHHDALTTLRDTYTLPYLGGEVTRTTAGKVKTTVKETLLVKGKIHGSFDQIGTETGRFSAKRPNLQNVPARSENGKLIRSLFDSGDGYKLIRADYSQIEPRVLADFSGDPTLTKAYMNGEDIYLVISEPLGIPRDGGKTMVLAMSYGIGDDKMANDLGVNKTRVGVIRKDFEKAFPSLPRYKRAVIAESKQRKTPYASTILGRRRYLPELYSRETWMKSRAERQAFNTKIQGSAADIIKIAMVRLDKTLADFQDAKLLLTVHDELVVRALETEAEQVAEAVREAMEGITLLNRVPLLADVKVVDNWGQAK